MVLKKFLNLPIITVKHHTMFLNRVMLKGLNELQTIICQISKKLLLKLSIIDGSLSPPLLDLPKRLIKWCVNVLGKSSRGVSLANILSLAS